MVSLAVKDIETSKVFYEKLGFTVFGGDLSQNWLILRNGDHTIGLFQGMFDKKYPHLQPGLEPGCTAGQRIHGRPRAAARAEGAWSKHVSEADESSNGPASFMVADPDGNTILVDQHV